MNANDGTGRVTSYIEYNSIRGGWWAVMEAVNSAGDKRGWRKRCPTPEDARRVLDDAYAYAEMVKNQRQVKP